METNTYGSFPKQKSKKLIEVALPIKEISAESVRDKSIRHGHISTLHLWWARRPLPVCRAIVFASLVPDPLDENCPHAFKDAVQCILNPENDPIIRLQYKTYPDIPYTAIFDPMEDNLRNRLMMFIGKFSDKCQKNMIAGKETSPKEQLDDGSLIKWENKNNPRILRMARELIWVAYNAEKHPDWGYETHNKNFNEAFNAIERAEDALYTVVDRHIHTAEIDTLESNLKSAIDSFQSQMPSVFDPFAGGGAIPLEAARLGCRSYGNDINPVAHIIEKGSAEFTQKYGKPIRYSEKEFIRTYGDVGLKLLAEKQISKDVNGFFLIPNRLSFDVEYFCNQIINETEEQLKTNYPSFNGKTVVAYYWARTAKCSNPSCGADIPLLKQFYLCNTNKRKIYLEPKINGNNIDFEIKEGTTNKSGFLKSKTCNLTCPCCGNVTGVQAIKEQSKSNQLSHRLLAIIANGNPGKDYYIPCVNYQDKLFENITTQNRPQDKMPTQYNQAFPICTWGPSKWGELYSDRQLTMIYQFIDNMDRIRLSLTDNDYSKALLTYLAIFIDKISLVNTTYGRYDTSRENVQHPYSKQALPMMFDYPESNPFSCTSGSAHNQLEWVIRYINEESSCPFIAYFENTSSGEKHQFVNKELTAVITDPPYYDAIGYADCSDLFYTWMKKTLSSTFPLNFSTPQTPKTDECTAIRYRFNDNEIDAKKHFENKLTQIFDAIELQTSDIVSIMFAHQSTEAWTTLCNSILDARMNITGSWPMDTELVNRTIGIGNAALESSVTVSCRPSERKGYGDFKTVKKDIEQKVTKEVEYLYELGFRGADLLTACFGQAVSEFGRYKSVEKSDGSEVSVAELLEMARNAAFNALLKGVQGDDFTKFYIGWLQLNGTGDADFDDATKFTRVGVNVNINDIKQKGLLIPDGKKIHIAMADEHIGKSTVEGTRPEDSPIDQAHRFILLFKCGDRVPILKFVRDICPESSSPLWRLLATLKELLPANDDQKQIIGILQNADDFRQRCNEQIKAEQLTIDFDNDK